MGSYGIGVGRLLACVAEEHHDERGLHLAGDDRPLSGPPGRADGRRAARPARRPTRSTPTSQAAGVEVLYDDREESPGVKFNDADLIGLPLRLTVGERWTQARRRRAEAP